MSFITLTGNGRGLSTDLWTGFDVENCLFGNENIGYGVKPNFACVNYAVDAAVPTVLYGSDGSLAYKDANMSIDQLDVAGGALRISGATQNEEAWVRWGGADGAPFVVSDTAAASFDLVMEVAFRPTYTAAWTDLEFFIGLVEKDYGPADFIANGGGLAQKSYLGFHQDAGDHLDIVYGKNAGAGVVHEASWKTLTSGTWYHLGFKFDASTLTITPWWGTGDRSTVAMASDNTSLIASTAIDDADFPDGVEVAPVVGMKCMNAGVGGSLDVRLLACAQLAPAAD